MKLRRGWLAAFLACTAIMAQSAYAQRVSQPASADHFDPMNQQATYVDEGVPCGSCGDAACGGGCDSCGGGQNKLFSFLPLFGCAPTSEPCPTIGVYGFSAYESWRGPSDGSFQNNNGGVTGINLAAPIPFFGDSGIAWQAGGSYGLYDWSGRTSASNPGNQSVQQQQFITYGFFRRADADRRVSWGVVQDWMINNNYGYDVQSFSITQWRAQLAYALSEKNEIGAIATLHQGGAFKTGPVAVGGPSTNRRWQGINTIQGFFHHKFDTMGADAWFNVGYAENYRLDPVQGGSLGNLLFSTTVSVPMNDRLSVYTNFTYLRPSGDGPSAQNALDDVFNFTLGMSFYPGNAARSRTVAGRKYMPYMPVANNGSFLVDYNNGNGP